MPSGLEKGVLDNSNERGVSHSFTHAKAQTG